MSEEKEVQKQDGLSRILSSVQPSVKDFLAPMVNLDESGQYFEPTCRLCTHEKRADIEVHYKSLEKVLPFETKCEKTLMFVLAEGIGNIPIDVIRNHLSNHLAHGDAEFRKTEYINKIRNLSSVEMGTFERIKFALAAISERIAAIASCENNDKIPVRTEAAKSKSINDLLKTWTSLIALQSELLGEMVGKGEVISIHKEDLDNVIGNALNNAKTEGERQLISNILADLEKAEIDRAVRNNN